MNAENARPTTTISCPGLEVICGIVRRQQANSTYSADDYEVCLTSGGNGGLPSLPVDLDTEPAKAALDYIRTDLKLTATQAYPLRVYGKPSGKSVGSHVVTALFAVPVAKEADPAEGYAFHNLSALLENSSIDYQLLGKHRNMLNSLDQWLRERHVIPFVNVDRVFLSSKEGEGVGGLVKAIIENPLHSARVKPPEDELVISLNNPIFITSSTASST